MRFASLGSGSAGNALVVEVKQTRVMLDCGFGIRATVSRLSRLGLAPGDLSGIVLTHEHGDHVGGAAGFAHKYQLPVWLTYGTMSALQTASARWPRLHLVDSHARFAIGDMEIEPFPVPHDGREPVQYVFGDGARRLGVLTDSGCATAHIEATLSGCDALVLECNHDLDMLRRGPYPPPLKRRISGRFGHLDNTVSAALLGKLDRSRLQHVVAAHLSLQNNTPQLAQGALAEVLDCGAEWVGMADQETGFDWRQVF